MSDIWTYLPLILMLVMLMLKTPVVYAILFPTLLYFLFGQTMSPSMMIVQKICTTMESFTYLALPFFTLAGVIFNYAGITRPVRLYTTPGAYIDGVTLDADMHGTLRYSVDTVGEGEVFPEFPPPHAARHSARAAQATASIAFFRKCLFAYMPNLLDFIESLLLSNSAQAGFSHPYRLCLILSQFRSKSNILSLFFHFFCKIFAGEIDIFEEIM